MEFAKPTDPSRHTGLAVGNRGNKGTKPAYAGWVCQIRTEEARNGAGLSQLVRGRPCGSGAPERKGDPLELIVIRPGT